MRGGVEIMKQWFYNIERISSFLIVSYIVCGLCELLRVFQHLLSFKLYHLSSRIHEKFII